MPVMLHLGFLGYVETSWIDGHHEPSPDALAK
ncbi:hypothetical protein BH11ARM2_BH11ARM2_26830 [soil metagenome]